MPDKDSLPEYRLLRLFMEVIMLAWPGIPAAAQYAAGCGAAGKAGEVGDSNPELLYLNGTKWNIRQTHWLMIFL